MRVSALGIITIGPRFNVRGVEERTMGEYTIPIVRRMETLAGGEVVSFTTIRQKDVKLNPVFPEGVFTEEFLQRQD